MILGPTGSVGFLWGSVRSVRRGGTQDGRGSFLALAFGGWSWLIPREILHGRGGGNRGREGVKTGIRMELISFRRNRIEGLLGFGAKYFERWMGGGTARRGDTRQRGNRSSSNLLQRSRQIHDRLVTDTVGQPIEVFVEDLLIRWLEALLGAPGTGKKLYRPCSTMMNSAPWAGEANVQTDLCDGSLIGCVTMTTPNWRRGFAKRPKLKG
jgi:hypothetical protein